MKSLKIILIVAGLILWSGRAFTQDSTQTERNQSSASSTGFLLTGYGFMGFEKEGDEQGTFGPAGFNPIFLWRKSEKLFFESEIEIEIEDGETEFELEYATLHYLLNRYFTLSAGKFLSPFGTFQEKLHPAWINKFSEKPLGFSHEGVAVGPMSEFGIAIRGGAQIRVSKINYTAYVSNGPMLNTGKDDPMMAGMLEYDNLGDNNDNKAIGGRLGILPFSNSSLELGISEQFATVGDKEDSTYEDVKAQMFAIDFSCVHSVGFLKSILDIKGQFNQAAVDKADYQDPMDTTGMATYTFDNTSQAYYVQIALRPALLKNKFFKNIELTGRYSSITLPKEAMWAGDKTQISVDLNYWLQWNSVMKFIYQVEQAEGEENESAIFIQWAISL